MSFRPPVPYNGSAPPCVPGIPTNLWSAGTWQPNPHWNPHAFGHHNGHYKPQAQVQWIPAGHWAHFRAQQHQHAQSQSNYNNPYRKQKKEPSKEYMAQHLSDNPLGLENMDPSKSLYNDIPDIVAGKDDATLQTTPWIWAPKPLENDAQDSDNTDSDTTDDSSDEEETPPDNPQSWANPWKPRDQHTPPAQEEGFNTQMPLRPTFSPNIVRTPEHYARSGSASIDSRMQSLHLDSKPSSTTPTPARQALSRHSSMPASHDPAPISRSISGVSQLSDEPDALLSPLIIARTPKPTSLVRQLAAAPIMPSGLGRHSSVPAVLGTIPESQGAHRTTTYPVPASSSASAYAASSQRRQSHDASASSSRASSRQPSPSPMPPTPPNYNTAPYAPIPGNAYAMSKNPPPTQLQPQQYYQTPPHSASSKSHTFPPYNSSSTPTPSSRRNSSDRERERERERYDSTSSSRSKSKPPPGKIPAPNFGSAAVTPGHSYPAYMSAPPGPPPPTKAHSFGSFSQAYPTPPSGDSPEKMVITNGNRSTISLQSTSSGSGGASANSSPYQRNSFSSSSFSHPNPHPPPHAAPADPKPKHRSSSSNSTTTAAPTSTPTGEPTHVNLPPRPHPHARRRGHWNSRGDHLTRGGYIVYAPPENCFPPELAHYPRDARSELAPPPTTSPQKPSSDGSTGGKDSNATSVELGGQRNLSHMRGYMDENGNYIPYMPRPELPESLPRYGKAPSAPYHQFVQWID